MSALEAACACGHPVGSHWEVAEPYGPRVGCGFLGCGCEFVSAPTESAPAVGAVGPEVTNVPPTPPAAVDLAALMDALDLAARAAFMAEGGINPGHVREDLLQATTAAAAAFPAGSEAFRAFAIVLGTIATAVTE